MVTSAHPFRHPRVLIHPGGFDPVRIQSRQSPRAQHVRLALEPGLSLFDALVTPLAEMGITSASMTILGGPVTTLKYCVGAPDPTGRIVVTYSAPVETGCSFIIFGNATLGKSLTGTPFVHCHATMRTEAGLVKGGHILPDETVIGPDPIIVLVTSLDTFELRQTYDPETGVSLLKPHKDRPS